MTSEESNGSRGGWGFNSFAARMRQQAEEVAQRAVGVSDLSVDAGGGVGGVGGGVGGVGGEAVEQASPASSIKSPSANLNVSKEELLEIVPKMQKKLKALSAALKTAQADKDRLLGLLKNEVVSKVDLQDAKSSLSNNNSGGSADADIQHDEVSLIQQAWRLSDER